MTNRRLKWCRFQIVRLKIVLRFLSLLRIRTVRLLITVLILSPSRHEGLIYVSDYETSRILVIDPATVAVKGEPVRFLRSYRMPNKPLSMGFFQNEMYVVCANNCIVRVDLRTGKELGSYSSFAGGVGLGTPGRLLFHNDTFYLAGRNANAPRLIQGKVMFVEISELD